MVIDYAKYTAGGSDHRSIRTTKDISCAIVLTSGVDGGGENLEECRLNRPERTVMIIKRRVWRNGGEVVCRDLKMATPWFEEVLQTHDRTNGVVRSLSRGDPNIFQLTTTELKLPTEFYPELEGAYN
jgi:hypothetical protein